jgi:CubicO group peptidase (beta-lactamase class C family)
MKKLLVVSVLAALAAGCCVSKCRDRACDAVCSDKAVPSGTSFSAKTLGPYVDDGRLPGVIAVLHKDGVEEVACLGYADVAAKRPITLDDPFMQCSQTKGFCGVTAAILIEEGRLNLDDPVSKYLPEFKNPLWFLEKDHMNWTKTFRCDTNAVLTVRMCLNHTGGFPFEVPGKQGGVPGGGWSGGMPIRTVAAEAAALPVIFAPGTKVSYSNTGIDIAAAVVEAITGQRWEDFLKERVLDPLGMSNTWFWPTDGQLSRQIEMYKVSPDKPAVHVRENPWQQRPYNGKHVFASAGAGLWTTARDQIKFYKMLMNLGVGDNGVRILKEETVKTLLAVSTRPKEIAGEGYSLGLSAPVVDDENGWFGHGGAWGTSCLVNWHRKQLKMWVVQLNGSDAWRAWYNEWNKTAVPAFFETSFDASGDGAYVGRIGE